MNVLSPGMSILEHVARGIGDLDSAFSKQVEPVVEAALPLRDFLLSRGHIQPFREVDIAGRSLATIDGAHVVEQKALADICISGAAIGEGAQYEHLYQSDQYTPTLADYRVVPHDASNTDLNRAIMAAQEISLMSMVDHNIRVLDGSWSSSMTSIYLTLLDHSNPNGAAAMADWLAMAIENEMLYGHEIAAGLDRLLSPWRYVDEGIDIVALSKSDSSFSYVKKFLDAEDEPEFYSIIDQAHGGGATKKGQARPKSNAFANLYSDRTLASLVLDPGEMFVPRSVASGRSLASRLDRTRWEGSGPVEVEPGKFRTHYGKPGIYKGIERVEESGKYTDETIDILRHTLIDSLLTKGYEPEGNPRGARETPRDCALRLDDHTNRDSHGERWIWTTYFKPSLFSPSQAALKMDYARTRAGEGSRAMLQVEAEERGRELAGYIDADVVNPEMQEAFSQYAADRRAKDVSRAANLVRQHIISNTADSRVAAGFIRGYRT